MASDQYSFQLDELLDLFLQRWTRIVFFGVMGALLGYIISIMLPARYEATSSILISLDYSRTIEQELVFEDRILDRAWHLVFGEETYSDLREELIADLGEFDAWESIDTLREHTRIDARLSRWEFVGIHTDPEIAVVIADTWQEVALNRLGDAMDHAWKAQSLQGVTFDMACVKLIVVEEWDDVLSCVTIGTGVSPDTIDELRKELAASHGLVPMVTYEPFQKASFPEVPILWSRGALVFAGGMLGFILGFLMFTLPKEVMRPDTSEKVDQ